MLLAGKVMCRQESYANYGQRKKTQVSFYIASFVRVKLKKIALKSPVFRLLYKLESSNQRSMNSNNFSGAGRSLRN